MEDTPAFQTTNSGQRIQAKEIRPVQDPIALAYDKLASGSDDPEALATLQAILDRDVTSAPIPTGADVAAWLRDDPQSQQAIEAIRSLLRAPKIFQDWGKVTAPDREWLTPRWLPRGRIGMLTGESEAGKSLYAVQMAVSITTGGGRWETCNDTVPKWVGPGVPCPFPETKSGHVVMANWEDEGEEVRRRLDWIAAAEQKRGIDEPLTERLDKRFTYIDMAQAGPIWGRRGPEPQSESPLTEIGKWLREKCEQENACLLILDPLANAYGGAENANEDAAEFVADWGGWARETDCAVLLVHHPPKNDKSSGGYGYRGAYAWQGEVRFYWQLTTENGSDKSDNDKADVLKCRKASYARKKPEPIYLNKDSTTGWIWEKTTSPDTQTTPTSTIGSEHDDFL